MVTPQAGSNPSFRLSRPSAEFFDEFAGRCGAVITGRHTYDLANAWNGQGPLPGAPLFVLTHRVPDIVPNGEPPYTFVSGGYPQTSSAVSTIRRSLATSSS